MTIAKEVRWKNVLDGEYDHKQQELELDTSRRKLRVKSPDPSQKQKKRKNTSEKLYQPRKAAKPIKRGWKEGYYHVKSPNPTKSGFKKLS